MQAADRPLVMDDGGGLRAVALLAANLSHAAGEFWTEPSRCRLRSKAWSQDDKAIDNSPRGYLLALANRRKGVLLKSFNASGDRRAWRFRGASARLPRSTEGPD